MNGWKGNTCALICSYSNSSNISMEKLLSILESVKWHLRVYLLFEKEIVCGSFVFKLYTIYPRFTNTDLRLNMPLINQINCLDSSFTTLRFLNYSKNKSCHTQNLVLFFYFCNRLLFSYPLPCLLYHYNKPRIRQLPSTVGTTIINFEKVTISSLGS